MDIKQLEDIEQLEPHKTSVLIGQLVPGKAMLARDLIREYLKDPKGKAEESEFLSSAINEKSDTHR